MNSPTAGMAVIEKDLDELRKAYEFDFTKHVDDKDIPRIREIWRSIPSLLSRERQYDKYITLNHFYRPVAWKAGGWTFAVYTYYGRDRFYNAHPKVFTNRKRCNDSFSVSL